MKIRMFQIDAFTKKVFGGNPAAVCILDKWLKETKMQSIAAENNLAETAFIVPNGKKYEIKWFTPTVEVALCGHATLAAAHVLYKYYGVPYPTIKFASHLSGDLTVTKKKKKLVLNFPSDKLQIANAPQNLIKSIGLEPTEVLKGKTDYLLIYKSQSDIEKITPDFSLLRTIDARGIIISAPGLDVDFVSRFFAPQVGINEDPVTGSAHTSLIPYWSKKLNKTVLKARQLSVRKGNLSCKYLGERVAIAGNAVTYLNGIIKV